MILVDACSPNKEKVSTQEDSDAALLFLGQKEPALVPEIFAPGIISKPDRYEFGCTFSQDGKELFFGVDNNGVTEIYHTRIVNGTWSSQEKLFKEDSFSHNDPMLSQDGQKLFFISDRPMEAGGQRKDIDIWYIQREKAYWSEPANLGPTINNALDQYYVSFADNGTLYFASKDKSEEATRDAFDIYRAEVLGEGFAIPEKLPTEINTAQYEADVFVAPDESYLIFCSTRADGFGRGDLYISFRDTEGNWSLAQNMGNSINTGSHELCPFVTRDGKYLFYTSNQDIYWVSAKILDDYRPASSGDY